MKVSVVIPAHNAGASIVATLGSVLNQTLTDIEVLVVDDGSTDETAVLASRIGPPVRCLRQEHSGVSTARNLGLASAEGDYVAFLDADDIWRPEKLKRQVRLLDERPDIGLCFTSACKVDASLRPLEVIRAIDYPDFCEALLLHSTVVSGSGSSVTARRAELERIGGFDPDLSQCADWDCWIRLSRRTRFAGIDEPLVLYRTAAGNMSTDIGLLERDTFAVLGKFFARDDASRYRRIERRCYSNHWMILSGSYLHAGQLGDSVRCLWNGVRQYPANISRPLGMPARWTKRLVRRGGRPLWESGLGDPTSMISGPSVSGPSEE